MHSCLVNTEALLADTCTIGRDEARHLKTVLRIKRGAHVQLFDGQGHTRLATVAEISRDSLVFSALEPAQTHPRPACLLTLFACISKRGRMDWTIEKAVELGANRIVPVLAERTIARFDPKESRIKADRWARVAADAGRQCHAAWLPEIMPPISFADSLRLIPDTAPVFVAALSPTTTPLRHALTAQPVTPPQAGWFVGPEGDFTSSELQALLQAGAIPVSLGQNILRAETACIYGLCVLACFWRP